VSWLGIMMICTGVLALALHADRRCRGQHGKAVAFALANAGRDRGLHDHRRIGARSAGNPWSYSVWLFVLDAIPFTVWILATRRREFVAFVAAQPAKASLAAPRRRQRMQSQSGR